MQINEAFKYYHIEYSTIYCKTENLNHSNKSIVRVHYVGHRIYLYRYKIITANSDTQHSTSSNSVKEFLYKLLTLHSVFMVNMMTVNHFLDAVTYSGFISPLVHHTINKFAD